MHTISPIRHGYRPSDDQDTGRQRVRRRCEPAYLTSRLNNRLTRFLDEISALVLDPGYSITRAGFAGEDTPKSVVPSYYGLIPSESSPKHHKQLFGDNSIHTPSPRISISNIMAKDGTVGDWDAAANLWEYAITSRLTNAKPGLLASNGLNDADNKDVKMEDVESQEKPLQENPLLMTETGWNAGKDREKGIEIAMENWGCPAFWLARSGVLASYVSHDHYHIAFTDLEQVRIRQSHRPRNRRRRIIHIHNPRPRRPRPQKRHHPLPPRRKLHLPTNPPPPLLPTTINPNNTTLPHRLQNPRRRRCPRSSHPPQLPPRQRTRPFLPPIPRRTHPDRIQRKRRSSVAWSWLSRRPFYARRYEYGYGAPTSWPPVRDA